VPTVHEISPEASCVPPSLIVPAVTPGGSRRRTSVLASALFPICPTSTLYVNAWLGTFEALAGCEWSRPGAGFALACRFNYVDDGDHDSRVLRFRLNQQGLIVGIDDRGGDSVFPAFFTLRVTKNLAASMAQEELAKNSTTLDADQRALLQFLSKSREPEEILAFLLNVQIVAGF